MQKAYGAGLYAMYGRAYEPEVCLAPPSVTITAMGPETAVNAVFFHRIQEKPESERAAFAEESCEEYRADIDLFRLANELHVAPAVLVADLRKELVVRFAAYATKPKRFPLKRHAVWPV